MQISTVKNAGLKFRHFKGGRERNRREQFLSQIKKGRSKAERPKSREETPKLGNESGEACQRTRTITMSRFGVHRNLNAYCTSTLKGSCIQLDTT